MQSTSALHEMLKFSLAYRAKPLIPHEKRKSPISLQAVAYVVMVVMRPSHVKRLALYHIGLERSIQGVETGCLGTHFLRFKLSGTETTTRQNPSW